MRLKHFMPLMLHQMVINNVNFEIIIILRYSKKASSSHLHLTPKKIAKLKNMFLKFTRKILMNTISFLQ